MNSKPTQTKSPTQTLPGPILNKRTNYYFEPTNVRLLNNDITYGQLVLNFGHSAVSVKTYRANFCMPISGRHSNGKILRELKIKSRLFFNRSTTQVLSSPHLTLA